MARRDRPNLILLKRSRRRTSFILAVDPNWDGATGEDADMYIFAQEGFDGEGDDVPENCVTLDEILKKFHPQTDCGRENGVRRKLLYLEITVYNLHNDVYLYQFESARRYFIYDLLFVHPHADGPNARKLGSLELIEIPALGEEVNFGGFARHRVKLGE
ncbi:hypothetical protein K474DRAFT_1706179 [Panus rudis PR-1116 ss-1]|nr:hypothetical protein K474DRAFT_1706179 [Panus rudis PR-1116 ss-1]